MQIRQLVGAAVVAMSVFAVGCSQKEEAAAPADTQLQTQDAAMSDAGATMTDEHGHTHAPGESHNH